MCEACDKMAELGKIAGAARDHEEAVADVADAAMALAGSDDVEMGPETTRVPTALFEKLLEVCAELDVAQEIALEMLDAAVARLGEAGIETGGLSS